MSMLEFLHQRYDNRVFPLVHFTLRTLPQRLHPVLSIFAGSNGPAALCGGGGVAVLLNQQDSRQISDLDFFCPLVQRQHMQELMLSLAPDHAFSEDLANGATRTTLFFRSNESRMFLKAEIEFHSDLEQFEPFQVVLPDTTCWAHIANPHTLIAKYLSKILTPGGCPWTPVKLEQRCRDIVALMPLTHTPQLTAFPCVSTVDRERLRQVFGSHMPAVERYLESRFHG